MSTSESLTPRKNESRIHDDPSTLNASLVSLFWTLLITLLPIGNYVTWIRFYPVLPRLLVRVNLALLLLCQVVFWVISGPYIITSHKQPIGHPERRSRLLKGIFFFFFLLIYRSGYRRCLLYIITVGSTFGKVFV